MSNSNDSGNDGSPSTDDMPTWQKDVDLVSGEMKKMLRSIRRQLAEVAEQLQNGEVEEL